MTERRENDPGSPHLHPEARELNDAIGPKGPTLRLVGGCVRDHLMGRKPKDHDLCTDAPPDVVTELSRKAGFKVIPTGLAHGTVTVVVKGVPLEVTTLRADLECDGRHAVVQFTDDWKIDAERRDLTINAMSMDFDGRLHDHFGGRSDVAGRIVRFVGDPDRRIIEDHLRILRFYRFAGKFPETGEPVRMDRDGLDATERRREGLRKISVERVWMEIKATLATPTGCDRLADMDDRGIAGIIGLTVRDPEAAAKAAGAGADPVAVLSTQLKNRIEAEALADRWKMSVEERKTLAWHAGIANAIDEKRLKIALSEGIERKRILDAARIAGIDHVPFETIEIPSFPVNGERMKKLGWKEGPEMGKALRTLRERWIESDFSADAKTLIESLDEKKAESARRVRER
jgi:tRNA nucleotidyltransferase/poly(A) polymerase